MRPASEKRSYYRINDLVGLSYKVIEDDETESTNKSPAENLGDSAITLLTEIDREFNQLTNILWQENPTAAKTFGLLNRKLSILAEHALKPDEFSLEADDILMVNISGSGIAFKCSEEHEAGTRLQLTLRLKPSNIKLELTGQVVGCEKKPDSPRKPFWLRVAFENGNGATQDQLIQHIVQKQYAKIGDSENKPDEPEPE